MSPVSPEFATSYGLAWAAHDPDAIVAMHTEDTVFEMHGWSEPAIGRAEVRAAIVKMFERTPDLSFARKRAHLGEDHFVTEYDVTGTVNGKRVTSPGADVFTMRDGLIARKDTYIDWLGYQRQVGGL